MNELFHYYAMKFLSLRSGFSPPHAHILAYSCQLPDRMLAPITVIMESGQEFIIRPTHHFGFWDKKQEREVWLPFHFFPSGESRQSRRHDTQQNPFIVRPNSAPVRELLIEALKSANLYRIGIALHSYADSWAHQNFVGQNCAINRIDTVSLLPPIGHVHVGSNPDIWSVEWIDPRLIPEYQLCNNQSRFMAAAKKAYQYLATFNRRPFSDWELIQGELETIIMDYAPEQKSLYPRKNAIRTEATLEVEFRLKLAEDALDPTAWFREAFPNSQTGNVTKRLFANGHNEHFAFAQHEIRKILKLQQLPPRRAGKNFAHSHIYQWALAAQEHRKSADRIIAQL